MNGLPALTVMSIFIFYIPEDLVPPSQDISHLSDSVHPLIHEFSNGHEMFLFNADNTYPG